MVAPVVTVSEDADIAEIGKLFTSLRIRRVPVVRDGGITGVVARPDLIRVIASLEAKKPQEEGIFGLDASLLIPSPARRQDAGEACGDEASPDDDGLSASNFRHLVD